ncbi:sugar/nucleoside kinase (ribokinase family) [Kribbella antiqua]|uniref:Sugar/nucleoside kinase (Ribokinase family) n=1 Tax=Kribbella antiqua TaxID=2512217 RepID=A0A4R2IGW3_9ACTN|nr:carbohydrate kinase family protein [Kribbella antiqua]TCO44013.1 sugar/nucleoside kinase (ribokinase family) [Kribbella antiqua]
MGTRIGVVAGLTVDHLVMVGHEPRFNELGGPGLYATLGARLVDGVVPVLATALPDDDDRFRSTFNRLGVDVSFATSVGTIEKVWILNSPEGRRIVSTAGETELGAGDTFAAPEPVPAPEFLRGLDGLLRSSPYDGLAADTIVGVDPHQVLMKREGIAYLRRVLPVGGILLPSRVQLRLLGDDPRTAAARLAAEFDCAVIARLDVDGMYVVHRGRAWHVVDDAVRVEETTGAGDASAGAIVAALAIGTDLATAALFGASVARIALSTWGSAGLVSGEPFDHPLDHIHAKQEVVP